LARSSTPMLSGNTIDTSAFSADSALLYIAALNS
jgi:hypothetical protein